MAFPDVTVPAFPNVPLAHGVPNVPRSPAYPPTPSPEPTSTDGPGVGQSSAAPSWGLFDSSGTLLFPDATFVSFEFMGEYRISDFPLEKGAFESYDKVEMPYEARLTLALSGTAQDRTTFIGAIGEARRSLDLYTVNVPEYSYPDVNIHHVDYTRKAEKGAAMIVADIWLMQIRVTATESFSNTNQPSGADATSTGTVQPTSPTPQQTAAAQPPAGT